MTYRERLNHWAVVRLLPNFQRVVVDRFRSRSDAEGHAQAMRRLVPDAVSRLSRFPHQTPCTAALIT